MAKVGDDLEYLSLQYQAYLESAVMEEGSHHGFQSPNSMLPVNGGRVSIDAVASGETAALLADLEILGLSGAASYGRIVSGQLPIASIDELASLDTLQFARPAYSTTSAGLVTSQGDIALKANIARSTHGLNGAGTIVGTLSDSYNCFGAAASDIATGDLPPGIVVLDDGFCSGTSDEGRAMMQIVHDVAPGAGQAFHSALGGQANFALGIVELASVAGGDVIVDDLLYFAEPMFQDGVIAQAVDGVEAGGVSYFSSAGNAARNAYEGFFQPGAAFPADIFPTNSSFDTEFGSTAPSFFGGTAHDFDPGPSVDVLQQITVPSGTGFRLIFQWDQPYFSVSGAPGAANELDIYVLNAAGDTVIGGRASANQGSDPVEFFGFKNPSGSGVSQFNLMIVHDSSLGGPTPGFLKYVMISFFGSIDEYDTASGTLFGHANAAGAEAVGAAAYFSTPAFGVSPPVRESFSASGPTRILFDTSGTPVFEIRQKPEITAPDGGNNTFFGSDGDNDDFPNFFGTSAAAPHVAGVAALMMEADPSLTPAEVYAVLEVTALDMATTGFDFDTGYGLVQAAAAVQAVIDAIPAPTPTPEPVPSLSLWALLALGTALGGAVFLRSRRTLAG